jgi:perosamine synthetase
MAESPIPWWKTNLEEAEIRAVSGALRERHINQGPLCRELELRLQRLLAVPRVVAVTNGSQAVLTALLACGVGPGDEVIVPAFTFIASAHAPLLLGARVRLVDAGRERPLIDSSQIEEAMTEKTRVIMPVHLNGRACDMPAINRLAARRGVKVVEDACQAFGSKGPQGWLGTLSDAGAFAMDMTKIITTGEGGFVAVRDEAAGQRLLRLRNQGVLQVGDNTFDAFGFNFKFPDLLAAVGLAQLDRLSAHTDSVRQVYRFYRERTAGLAYLRMLDVRIEDGELPLWAEVLCAERDQVVALLRQRGIVARPHPPTLAGSAHLGAAGRFPNAEFFARHGLILPCGPDQRQEDLERVADALHEIAAEIRGHIEPPGGSHA